MSPAAPGCAVYHHRARLFPLPFIPAACAPPCNTSRRIRLRLKVGRIIAEVTNNCILTLNQLYSSPSSTSSFPHFKSQPDTSYLSHCQSVAAAVASHPVSAASSSQQRVVNLLRERCATFVTTARTWCLHGPACASVTESTALHLLDAVLGAAADASAAPTHTPPTEDSSHTSAASGLSFASLTLPSLSSFSSSSTPVVPLVAARVSLPDVLNIVPLELVLPPDVAVRYSAAAAPTLMRPVHERLLLDAARPLRRPRIAGSRAEYVQLVRRMHSVGMLSFTSAPLAVNGVFTVAKDADADRLIIDAQPCNRLFVESPHVSLPNPSHLVQLQLPPETPMFVAKTDLSNFYHHLGLPAWMQPFFALPPLSPAELASVGVPTGASFPMCVTLPMGFSHAVHLAQTAHEHVVYGSGALSRDDSLLCLRSPSVSSSACVHGIVIDDFFLFSLSRDLAQRVFDAVLRAYRAAGLVVKQSKVVAPTVRPVKVIGFDIDGAAGTISLPADSHRSLFRATVSLLDRGFASSTQVAHVVGRWTWLMMLRRPSLAVLQHVYRWVRVARGPRFALWPSVRAELVALLGLQPLLSAHLREPLFHRIIASDASELAAGVVSTPLTAALHSRIWPLCSTRHCAALQTQLNGAVGRRALAGGVDPAQPPSDVAAMHSCMDHFQQFYDAVGAAPWRTLVSAAWRAEEHINALELRAALLAVHWALSFPSALGRRVYLLLDSTVALFSLWKGRSSSPMLLPILRKISATLLAGGISLLCGWVPSAVNPADAPSRALDTGPDALLAA